MNYKLIDANINDLDYIKEAKLNTIFEYANDLSKKEKNKIIKYVDNHSLEELNREKIIIINDKKAGMVLVTPIADGLLIDEIYIESEYRNKGIGTHIIKNILNNNRKENIYLWVYKENDKARSLYSKLGFKIIDETDNRFYMWIKQV